MFRTFHWGAILLSLLPFSTLVHAEAQPITLQQAYETLVSRQFVDLTHAFEPGIPHWPGFPDETRGVIYGYKKGEGTLGEGFLAHRYSFVGQWGTHVDPPVHFVQGLRTVDQIPVKEMILPLAVLNCQPEAVQNPDYTITLEKVLDWEKRHGRIPPRAFVALRTGWSQRWPDAAKMANKDAKGVAHYPGWSKVVLQFLLEERNATAIGHETTDTDPGLATSKDDYSLEFFVLSTNHYQIEMLANLDQVPEAGALAVVSFPKPKGGSGFPARVFAILP